MIRAANHSSYPLDDSNPPDHQLLSLLEARARGEATDEEVAEIQDEVATIVVAEQSRAFINIVTDGMVCWSGPLSHLARHLEGVEQGEQIDWFETGITDTRPVVRGPIGRTRSFLSHDFEVARGVAQTPVKVVLPGPVTFARIAADRHYGDHGSLAGAVAEALAAEVGELARAGATHFQLDEPLLCRHPEDLELVVRTAGPVFSAAGADAITVLSTYFGDLAPLANDIGRLPGTHIGLDVVRGGANFDLLQRLPESRGVALGLFDATRTEQEDATDVARALEPYREALTGRDVIVGPQSGLAAIPRDEAFDKLLQARYLVEKLTRDWQVS